MQQTRSTCRNSGRSPPTRTLPSKKKLNHCRGERFYCQTDTYQPLAETFHVETETFLSRHISKQEQILPEVKDIIAEQTNIFLGQEAFIPIQTHILSKLKQIIPKRIRSRPNRDISFRNRYKSGPNRNIYHVQEERNPFR